MASTPGGIRCPIPCPGSPPREGGPAPEHQKKVLVGWVPGRPLDLLTRVSSGWIRFSRGLTAMNGICWPPRSRPHLNPVPKARRGLRRRSRVLQRSVCSIRPSLNVRHGPPDADKANSGHFSSSRLTSWGRAIYLRQGVAPYSDGGRSVNSNSWLKHPKKRKYQEPPRLMSELSKITLTTRTRISRNQNQTYQLMILRKVVPVAFTCGPFRLTSRLANERTPLPTHPFSLKSSQSFDRPETPERNPRNL
jgi:hypothetical protein